MIPSEHPDVQIIELEDPIQIATLLETQRGWAVYALCDLEQPYRSHARYIGAVRDGVVTALLLIYAPPGFTSVVPCGSPADLVSILAVAQNLPASATLLTQRENLGPIESRFHVEELLPMLRMVATADTLQSPPRVDADIVLLRDSDLPRLQGLYSTWADTVFSPEMFAPGLYYGAIRDGVLVAVAGTHAISRRYRIGVIGNVYTHPDHRNLGLARAVTAAVARALIDQGILDVGLNVRKDNAAAVTVYTSLGFIAQEPFIETTIRVRPSGLVST